MPSPPGHLHHPSLGTACVSGVGTDLPGCAGAGAASGLLLGLLRWLWADAGFLKDKPYDRLEHSSYGKRRTGKETSRRDKGEITVSSNCEGKWSKKTSKER